MAIKIVSIEHGIATAVRDLGVGAKAVSSALAKVAAVVEADAPTVEALTALVDPRAAVIERIGAALIGQVLPQIEKVTGDVATDAQAPTVSLTAELYADLKSLAASLGSEIAGAKTAASAS